MPSLWDLSDLCTPWCIRVAVTLRIAERIAAGATAVEDLAAAAGCDAYALHCMLGRLASRGVFEETGPGRFALNDAARELLDPATRLGLDLDGTGGRMSHGWATLPTYVRTGAPAYREMFGLSFWEDLDAHPDLAAGFDELMGITGHGRPEGRFELTGGWQAVRTVVDVGGGTGAMLAEILRLHPHVQGTLVDLPRTAARAAAALEAEGLAGRARTVGQSFFDPLPAGADLYLLRGVLNDWPDAEDAAILRRCAEAARPAGRVVVLKSVGPDDAPRRMGESMVLVGGKDRRLGEFEALAAQADLEVAATGRQPSGQFVVECRLANGRLP